MLTQHVHQLQADRVTQRLGDLGHSDRLLTLHIGIDDRLAARLACRAFRFGGQFEDGQIDAHRYTDID